MLLEDVYEMILVLEDILNKLEFVEIGFEVGVLIILNGIVYLFVELIKMLNVFVGKYGVGCIDYVENCFVGIKFCEVYECLVVMMLIIVYKELEDLIYVKEVVYFKLVIE